jgi:hypothetical protein
VDSSKEPKNLPEPEKNRNPLNLKTWAPFGTDPWKKEAKKPRASLPVKNSFIAWILDRQERAVETTVTN